MTDRIGTMPARRRRLAAATAAVATVAVIGSLAVQPFAAAAPPLVMRPLPQIGEEVPLSLVATDVPVGIGGRTVTATFSGGLEARAEVNPADPYGSSVGLRVVRFDMLAEVPEVGRVTLASKAGGITPLSVVSVAKYYPMVLKNTLVLDFTLSVERLPGAPSPAGDGGLQAAPAGPVVLTPKAPVVLVNDRLAEFPPAGDLYRLQRPIELVLPNHPGVTLATVERFPVRVWGM